MNNFGKSSTHNFSLVEVLVFVLAIVLVVFVAWPKILGFTSNLKVSNVVDSVYSYKDSVNKFYVSRLMFDSNFNLNGRYTITDGNLVASNDVYNLHLTGNVPSDGYLDYENNVLKDGCIVVGGYYVLVSNGDIESVTNDSCMINDNVDVALGDI